MQKQRQQPFARMSKSVTLLLVSFCIFEEAFSLNCYTHNFSTLMSDHPLDLNQTLRDCDEFISGMPSSSSTEMLGMQVLRCFVIRADYLGIVFKGCLPEGQCDSMKKAFWQMLQSGGTITSYVTDDAVCSECEEDMCNGDTFIFTNNSVVELVPTITTTTTTVINNNHSHGVFKLKLINVCLLLYSIYLYR